MGIIADDIARVRSATDIVAVIGEHTEVKRVGRNWMARCPLHGERTPSLSVAPDKGVYYCFGCQRSGDVFTFVQEIEGLDFVGAVEMLAGRAGIHLTYTSSDEGAARSRLKRLRAAVAQARDFYHQRLLDAPDAGAARDYLRSRGYDGALVRAWKIGWAPDGWDTLARQLKLSRDDLRDSGLGYINRAGRQQDFFRGRIVFPITDERGDAVGFGGRIMPGSEGPKYLNTSSEAVTYAKNKVLYGLHEHRRQIVNAGQAVVCEGYTDVIGCAQAGLELAVASCGTALTEEHVRLLKSFSAERLVLAFDADAAGAQAAGRVYAWERRFGVEVVVADLPTGSDPGDLARTDPEALRGAVADAVPLLQFRVDRSLAGADLSSIESRARAAERAVGVVGEHPDPMVRDPHVVAIADRCQVDRDHLRRFAASGGDQPSGVGGRGAGNQRERLQGERLQDERPAAASSPDRLTPEDEALRLAIHAPEEMAGRLDATLLFDPARREAYEALRDHGDVAAAAAHASPAAARVLHRLAVDAGAAAADDVLARVARLAADRAMGSLRRTAAATADAALREECIVGVVWLKTQTEHIDDPDAFAAAGAGDGGDDAAPDVPQRSRTELLDELLGWLVGYWRSQEPATQRPLVASGTDPG